MKISKIRVILWMLLMLVVPATFNTLYAQNAGTISGILKAAQTGEPVKDAEVLLKPIRLGTISNELGEFRFENLKPGKYTIIFNHMGCASYEEEIQVSEGERKYIEVELWQDSQYLEGIEITETIFLKETYIKDVITEEQIQAMPARDIGDFLRKEPNINAIRKGGGNLDPVVRGLKFNQLNVQSNTGQKIEGGCPNRMDPAASHININDISRIEILKGPYALRYGPNFGAVLNLVTEKAKPYNSFQLHARAMLGWESNWNGNKQHLSILGGGKTIYFALSANNQDYGNYTAGNGELMKSSFRKYNFSGELGIVPKEHHEIKLSYKNSQGRDVNFPTLPMDERSDNTQLYAANYHYKNKSTLLQTIHAKMYYSDVNHEMDNKWRPFSDTVVAVSTIHAVNAGGRVDFGFKWDYSALHTGMDYENISKDGQRVKSLIMQPNLPVKTEDLWNNASIQNLGFFAEYKLMQNAYLDWILAGRLDMNKASSDPLILNNMMGVEMFRRDTVDSDFLNYSFSAGLSYKITTELSVDFALGRGVRSPDMVERFIILLPVGYDNYDYLGNPELNPENNHQADLTLKYVCDRSGSFRLNGFYSYITDYITGIKLPPSQVMPQSTGVLGVKQFQNIDKAHMYGMEFLWISPIRFDWGINLSAAYTAGINPETIKYIYENGEVVSSEIVKNDPLPEIPPFELNASLEYRFLENRLAPLVNLRFVSKQNHISEAYDESETPGFFTAGARINYQYNDLLSFSAGVENIFDEAYYEHLNRRIIGSDAEYYEPGRSFYLNIILNL